MDKVISKDGTMAKPRLKRADWSGNKGRQLVDSNVYTLGAWRVKPGQEEAFVAAWKGLGTYFYSLPKPPGPGTLVQSVQDPSMFYSFGPWPSEDDIKAMRADPRTPEQIGKLSALCEKADPGTYRVVARAP